MKKDLFLSLVSLFACSFCIAQNVGIGTNTPTRAKLEVNGAVDATSAIFGGESSGISIQRNWPGIGFNNYYNGGNKSIAVGYGAKQYLDPNNGYMFLDMFSYAGADNIEVGANRAFTISPFGNIGVLGGTPNGELQLPNTIANRKIVLWETANNNHQFFGLGIESGTMRYNVAGTDNVHRFYAGTGISSSTLLMSIWGNRTVTIGDENGGGKLGINISSPPATLTVRQAGNTGIYIQEAASGSNWEFRAQYTVQTDYGVLLVRHDNSDVGWFTPSGPYTSPSDERLKTNIEDIPSTLEKVLKLKPKVYEMIANNSRHEKSIGFIAQQVNKVFPELVSINESITSGGETLKNVYGLNYNGFGVIAIKAIQEQQQEIEMLQKQNLALLKRLEALEAKK